MSKSKGLEKRKLKSQKALNSAYKAAWIQEHSPLLLGGFLSLCLLAFSLIAPAYIPHSIPKLALKVALYSSVLPLLVILILRFRNRRMRRIAQITVRSGLGRAPSWLLADLMDQEYDQAHRLLPHVKTNPVGNILNIKKFKKEVTDADLKTLSANLSMELRQKVVSAEIEYETQTLRIKLDALPAVFRLDQIPRSLPNKGFLGRDSSKENCWWDLLESSMYDIRGSAGAGKSVHGATLTLSVLQGIKAAGRTYAKPLLVDPKAGKHFASIGYTYYDVLDPGDIDQLKQLCVWFEEVHKDYMNLQDKTVPSPVAHVLILEEAERYLSKKEAVDKESKEVLEKLISYVNRWAGLYRSVGWPCILITQSMDAESLDIKRTNLNSRSLACAMNPAMSQALIGSELLFDRTLTKGKWLSIDRNQARLDFIRTPFGGKLPDHLTELCSRK